MAYNIQRQKFHRSNGRNFYYSPSFFKLYEEDNIDGLAKEHFKKVSKMQKEYSYLMDKYGLAFDHSQVNITWKDNDIPVSLEVHKCRRDYLFNLEKCKDYIHNLKESKEKEDALIIMNRIEELL